jgi:hypothetical protein
MAWSIYLRRIVLVWTALSAVALLVGCESDEIRTYRVPRDNTAVAAAAPQLRLLAASFPHGERTWFLKLMGPATEVGHYQDVFDRFVRSVRFPDKGEQPITWDAPEGWKQEPGSALRYATFRPPDKDSKTELTVVALGREAGSLLANVNRWRGQIGLKSVSEEQLSKIVKEEKINGVATTLVDMTGSETASTAAPVAKAQAPEASRAPLHYTVPPGWKQLPGSGSMRLAAFQVGEGSQTAEVTIVPLAGQAGGLLENVKRWRGQIGLSAGSDEQIEKEIKSLQVGDEPGRYVDLIGPDSPGRQPERILAVAVMHGEQTWFFKMKGPADLVGKQKSDFESFVQSVRFAGGKGATNG